MPNTVKLLEDGRVSPPPGSVPTTSLPLTFLDIKWLGFSALQRLFFYDFPHPTSYFLHNTLPNLKTSLSLTLHHFFPLAGKLLLRPTAPRILPYILYKEGDSVSLIVNESTAEFNYLIGDHARRVEELLALVPELPPGSMSPNGCMEKPLIAFQITVFPMAGISIGVAFCHSAADGRTFSHFMKSWASAHRSPGDLTCISLNNSLPNFNRDLIKDPSELASIFFNLKSQLKVFPRTPVDKLRVTLRIKRSQIELLKDLTSKKYREEDGIISEPLNFSTFVVTCAYMWVCLIKLQDRLSSGADGDARCHFTFSADCRERLKLPATYFGNCIGLKFTTAKRNELTGEDGIFVAARAIGRQVMEVNKEPLKGAEKWVSRADEIFKSGDSVVAVVASPKLGVYKIDFGWGRPMKTEVVNLGSHRFFALTESREEEGGVEFGLALALDELDSFNAIFFQGLSELQY